MARSGDVLEHPVTRERFVWRKVARDTGVILCKQISTWPRVGSPLPNRSIPDRMTVAPASKSPVAPAA